MQKNNLRRHDMTEIETARLVLRKPDGQDVQALTDFYISERSEMAGGNVSYSEAVTVPIRYWGTGFIGTMGSLLLRAKERNSQLVWQVRIFHRVGQRQKLGGCYLKERRVMVMLLRQQKQQSILLKPPYSGPKLFTTSVSGMNAQSQ